MNRRLRAFLRQRGASHDEIARAEREGRLALLTFDKVLLPGRARYRFDDVVDRARVDPDGARRIWRALGFPDPPPDARRFTDTDVEALVTLREWFRADAFPERTLDALVQQTRVVGGSLAKVAEVQSDAVIAALRIARAGGLSDEEVAEMVPESLNWDQISRLMDYTLRLQLRAALWRKYAGGEAGDARTQDLTIGFVDLVGYTALSQELEQSELAKLVERFESLAYDIVAEEGARVVKTIGDEVMFVAEAAAAAGRIALRLTERSAVDEILPEARAGLACGPVIAHEGDYYGPVVNLASRMVELARPGSVLVSEELHGELEHDASFGFQRLRSRRIRDIGRVVVWLLEAPARDRGHDARTPASE